MARPSGKTQRMAALAALCQEGAILRISEAARRIGSSEITLRRDLSETETGLACLGGYVMRATEGREGYSLSAAGSREADAKKQAAAQAAERIEAGDTVFIDCGTTTPYLAALLPLDQRITVVTHALNIAEAIAPLPGINLILLGGLYHRETSSFSSIETVSTLSHINITKGFFSAAGVHESEGVTCFNFHEIKVKRAALERSLSCYLVCDASKWGQVRPATYARLDSFEAWFGAPEGWKRNSK